MTKVIVKTGHWLPRHLNVLAITLGTTVYCALSHPSPRLLVHECQHVRQFVRQRHSRWLFFTKYLGDYLRARIMANHSHLEAYLGIGAEEEAREMAWRYETVAAWSDGERFPVHVVMQ